MELMEGGNLADLVRNGPLPPGEAAWLVEQIALGVQAVHEQGGSIMFMRQLVDLAEMAGEESVFEGNEVEARMVRARQPLRE